MALKTFTVAEFDSILDVAHKVAVAEKTKITMVDDVADSLDGKYFLLATGGSLTHTHYVWFDSSVGAAADPAPGGTGIAVAFDPNDTADVIAGLVQAAINATFPAVVDGASVIITNAATGQALDAADGDAGVTVEVLVKGRGDDARYVFAVADLGLATDEDHFGEIWEVLGSNIRITSATFQFLPDAVPSNDPIRAVVLIADEEIYDTPILGLTDTQKVV